MQGELFFVTWLTAVFAGVCAVVIQGLKASRRYRDDILASNKATTAAIEALSSQLKELS